MKTFLRYEQNSLRFGEKSIDLAGLVAGSDHPTYVYDLTLASSRMKALRAALPTAQVHYAMKANANVEVLKALRDVGAGADVVSAGEIRRAVECGFKPENIIFSGVGKTDREIRFALETNIAQINVESLPELIRLGEIAREMGKKARLAFRLNPDVDIKTHPYIATGLAHNKFGIELCQLPALEQALDQFKDSLILVGTSLHLGSQMLELDGLREGIRRLRPIYEALKIRYSSVCKFDAGGGLGILYDQDAPESEMKMLEEYARIISEETKGLDAQLQLEPGRWIVGHAGVLLTQVVFVKKTSTKTFVIVNSGMNHLIRPALYQAKHRIVPLKDTGSTVTVKCDVVGPICESADFFARDLDLPPLKAGDWVAVLDAGAYGYTLASTYNLQDLPREIAI